MTSLYQLVNTTNNEIVYVGLSKRPSIRYQEHIKIPLIIEHFDYISLQLALIGTRNIRMDIVDQYDDKQQALQAERMTIAELDPICNIYGTNKRRRSN